MKIVSFIFLIYIASTAVAQSAVVSLGGELAGAGGAVSLSVGLVDYVNTTNAFGSQYEGVQQPFEIYIVENIAYFELPINMSVYPNPVQNILTLQHNGDAEITCLLYDVNGRQISSHILNGAKKEIPVSGLAAGAYLLQAVTSGLEKTFLVIKTN